MGDFSYWKCTFSVFKRCKMYNSYTDYCYYHITIIWVWAITFPKLQSIADYLQANKLNFNLFNIKQIN